MKLPPKTTSVFPPNPWPSIAEFLAEWLDEPRLQAAEQAVFDRYYRSYRAHFGPYIRRYYAEQTAEANALVQRGAPRLLEVGAGCGTEGLWFALQGASVTSVDINEERLKVARARQALLEAQLGRKLNCEFKSLSLFDLDEPESFDIVWMEQTFHHLEPRQRVHEAIAGALSPGGHVVISEANAWNPFLQARLFRKRGFRMVVTKTLADGRIHQYGNERVILPGLLAKGFRQVGVEPVSTRFFRTFPNKPWADSAVGAEKVIPVPLRALVCTHYTFVGRKSGG